MAYAGESDWKLRNLGDCGIPDAVRLVDAAHPVAHIRCQARYPSGEG